MWSRLHTRQGAFTTFKIKSHLTSHDLANLLAVQEARTSPSLILQASIVGNTVADMLADMAAHESALPQHIVQSVRTQDELASRVRHRLLVVVSSKLELLPVQSMREERRDRKGRAQPAGLRALAKPRVAPLRSLLRAKATTSGHVVAFSSLKVSCLRCKNSSRLREGMLWASAPCSGKGHTAGVHAPTGPGACEVSPTA